MSRKEKYTALQLRIVMLGIGIMLLGHICLLLPAFKGFPTDILSGIINAFCLFYVIYKRHLFKLTLLISRANCYMLGAAAVLFFVYNSIRPLEKILDREFKLGISDIITAVSAGVLLMAVILYGILRFFINCIFEKEEIIQSEHLQKFSFAVSKTLKVKDILSEMSEILYKTMNMDKVYICIEDEQGDYMVKHSSDSSTGEPEPFIFQKNHPVIQALKEADGCLFVKDFRRSAGWDLVENAERILWALSKIECIVALMNEQELIGIVLISGKQKNSQYTYDDVNFLKSMSSIASIAIKNSRLYEKAFIEARTDELTGLLNRKCFMETLAEQAERRDGRSLVLLLLNLDDFRLFNKLYGGKEGDESLKKVAEIIKNDVGEKGYVARYGGKEFAAILPGSHTQAAKDMAENICRHVKGLNSEMENYALKMLTLSCGISALPETADTVEQLIYNADLAVYHVKHTGKNAVMIYTVGTVKEKEKQGRSVYSEYAPTVYALTAAIDTKDHYTFSHSKNVAYYSGELAKAYGLNDESVEIVKEAGLLHDIGKIGIPENILNKPGKLEPEEYEIMKRHVENSIGIIRHLPSLDYVIPAVIGHHERYDGKGYPRRLAGEEIPLMARILCVADSFDAMISKRSYKKSIPVEKAVEILKKEAGSQFDPKLIPVFVKLIMENKLQIASE